MLSSDGFGAYLKTLARFHSYSSSNVTSHQFAVLRERQPNSRQNKKATHTVKGNPVRGVPLDKCCKRLRVRSSRPASEPYSIDWFLA